MRAALGVVLLLLPSPVFAERLLTGFAGAAPNGRSGILDLAQAVGTRKAVWGISVGRIGDVFGWEIDASASPGFFSSDKGLELVSGSQASLLMLNALLTAPQRWTGPRIRPYALIGGGIVKARIDDVFGLFRTETVLGGMDVGGGLALLPWRRLGLRGDVRYVRSNRKDDPQATLGFGPAYLDLWRVTAGAIVRF